MADRGTEQKVGFRQRGRTDQPGLAELHTMLSHGVQMRLKLQGKGQEMGF